jgi:hypothetical protein
MDKRLSNIEKTILPDLSMAVDPIANRADLLRRAPMMPSMFWSLTNDRAAIKMGVRRSLACQELRVISCTVAGRAGRAVCLAAVADPRIDTSLEAESRHELSQASLMKLISEK